MMAVLYPALPRPSRGNKSSFASLMDRLTQKSKIVNRKSVSVRPPRLSRRAARPPKLFGVLMPKPSSKKTEKPVEELSYEEALAELEEIVSALEGEQNQLEDAIKLFERGQALALRCGVLLEAAELKVKQVVGDVILPFEDETE